MLKEYDWKLIVLHLMAVALMFACGYAAREAWDNDRSIFVFAEGAVSTFVFWTMCEIFQQVRKNLGHKS